MPLIWLETRLISIFLTRPILTSQYFLIACPLKILANKYLLKILEILRPKKCKNAQKCPYLSSRFRTIALNKKSNYSYLLPTAFIILSQIVRICPGSFSFLTYWMIFDLGQFLRFCEIINCKLQKICKSIVLIK